MNEAAVGVLGAALLDPGRVLPVALARGVGAEWFAESSAAAVWEAMEALWKRRSQVDLILVAEEMRRRGSLDAAGGMDALERMVDKTGSATHADFYLDNLREGLLARGLEKAIEAARAASRESPLNAVTELQETLRTLLERGMGQMEVSKRDLLVEKLEQWKEVARQRFELQNWRYCMGAPLPWACLNSVFNGLRPGLHVLGARTSVGKTVYALNVSQFWCETGVPHVFVTLDMQDAELLSRYVSAQARVSLRKLEWGARHEELAAAEAQIEVVEKAPVHLTHESRIERLAAWLRLAQHRWGIKGVILDYVQLVRMQGDRRMRGFERVCEVVQMLKELANEMKMPFLLLAQLSREIDNAQRDNVYAEPRLADLGDSSEIEKAAASVTLMYRDQIVEQVWRQVPPTHLAYGDEHLARNLRALWLKVEKNQQGLAGVRRPFVMYPNQFILRPACYECREPVQDKIPDPHNPARDKTVVNWGPAFYKIRDDWRILPEDDELAALGGLGAREYKEGE